MCERLRFGDQRETRLYQTLGEHQPVELRPRFHHEREVLLDLGEPGEVDGRHQKLGGPPQFVDAVIDRHRADPGGAFGDISLDVGRRDLRGRSRASVEAAGPLQEAEECSVPPGKIVPAHLGEVACGAARLEPRARPAGIFPGPPIGIGPFIDRQRPRMVASGLARRGVGPAHLFRRLQLVLHVLHHHLAEDLARLDVRQADVEIDRGLHVAVTEELLDQLIFAGTPLEHDGAAGVPELVHRHPQPRRLKDALGDLAAERDFAFGPATLSRKQPVLVPAPQQGGPEVVDVIVDQSRDVLLERKFQLDPVLDVVIREDEPVVRVGATRLDQVEPELDRGQVGEADRRKAQDRDGDRELGGDLRGSPATPPRRQP